MKISKAAVPAERNAIKKLGSLSWSILGIVAVVVITAIALGAIRGIFVPLVIAIVFGTILEPFDILLEKWRLKPALASLISMLVAILILLTTAVILVLGFLDQLPEIAVHMMKGWQSFLVWARELDLDPLWLDQIRVTAEGYLPHISQGMLGAISSTFSGAISFGLGSFFALFFLFFVLRDGRKFPGWFASATKLDAGITQQVDFITRDSIRGYFKGTAITALITAPIFIIPLLILKVPLVFSLFIMYFFLSFVPYIGAWITGLFAVLIAFGSGGSTAALIVALSLLISNGAIQSAVSSWALGSSLKMHPVLVLLATIIGGTIAGALGMILAPPLLAAFIKSSAAIRAHNTASVEQEV